MQENKGYVDVADCTNSTAMAAAVASPQLPRTHKGLELPIHKLKYRRRDTDDDSERRRAEQREEAAQRGEEVSRARARAYLNDFLEKSEWGTRMNQFTVDWDAVPTMEELESYGGLDETEGTRACRKLFRAVVVWDELGNSLWQRLKITSKQKKDALKGLGPMLMMGVVGDDGRRESDSSDKSSKSSRRARSSSRESSSQHSRTASQQSFKNRASRSKTMPSRQASQDCLFEESPDQSDYSHDLDETSRPEEQNELPQQRPGFQRIISQNCASAVRKTLGVFGDGRSSGTGQRNRSG